MGGERRCTWQVWKTAVIQSFGKEIQGKGNQEDLGVGEKPTNTDPEGTGQEDVDWIYLAQDRLW